MHMSLHPFYVRERQRAGRRYAFRPEKQRLLDALWPVLVSFCDAGKHTVGMSVSRLARELSRKMPGESDFRNGSHGSPDFGIDCRAGPLWCPWRIRRNSVGQGITEATAKYVWITPVGWKMLGVDLMKLQEQQLKKLRECEERQALIKEGLLGEHEEISVLRARKRWYEQRSREALQYRRAKGPHVSVQTVWPECPGPSGLRNDLLAEENAAGRRALWLFCR
jgi:hypothetical protein